MFLPAQQMVAVRRQLHRLRILHFSNRILGCPILSYDGATNATLIDFVPGPRALLEKFAADCDLLEYLCARLKELFAEDTEKVLTIWKDYPEGISDRKVAKVIGYPQRTFANKMKRFRDKYRHLLDN